MEFLTLWKYFWSMTVGLKFNEASYNRVQDEYATESVFLPFKVVAYSFINITSNIAGFFGGNTGILFQIFDNAGVSGPERESDWRLLFYCVRR